MLVFLIKRIIKIKKLFTLLLILSVYTKFALAEIIETTDFSAIETYLQAADSDTLVIFDIDEVIIETTDAILKPQHKKHFLKFEEELSERYSKEQALYLRSIIYDEENIKLVQEKILNTLNDLQNRNVKTIAITYIATGPRGRIAKFEDWGLARLTKLDIDFSKLNNLKDHKYSEIPSKYGVPLTKNGVTFTALAEKGVLLDAILKHNNIKPRKIIFIDDKLNNLKSVESTCNNLNIPFIGIQYTAVINSKEWKFNEEIARMQFKILEKDYKWLSDQEALINLTS
jgi:histidinol phosphatase-like enzyme